MGGESEDLGGSVVVCTRDRRALLAGCLASLEAQAAAEVVVVDNGSTDGTAPFLADWACRDPGRRRVVPEPVAGLSRARNAGVAAARAEIVLFLDDDALAPPGWVAAHLDAYRRDPGVAAVGGPVVLTWPDGRPGWLTPPLEHWFSALDHGLEAQPFPPPHGPYGTNMSVRRAVVAELGGFPEDLGRRGRSLLSSEEADLWRRLWAAGHTIAYDPATVLDHRVSVHRMRRSWVLRRGWGQGRSNARRRALEWTAGGGREVVGACRTEARFAVHLARQAARSAYRGDRSTAVDEAARCAGHTSAVVEHLFLAAKGALAAPLAARNGERVGER